LLQAATLLSMLVFSPETTDLKSVAAALFCGTYPNAFLCVLLLVNHLAENSVLGGSLLAMLFIFVVSPMADVLAFTFGMTLRKKFPRKLAPKASPNKTLIGFIGGLLGGGIAGAGLYFVYHAICGGFENMYIQLPVYVALGVLISLVTVLGDLVESSIKRHCGVKDMGNIMPGHGGVLDRIDGTMFASVIVYAVFIVCTLFV
jgi:CDP-diglyceride synthetase